MTYKTTTLTAELMALRDENGLIHAREAVKWARRHRNSQLHQELDWDNEAAAEEWRVHQVRRLIAIHIVDDDKHRTIVSLSVDRSQGGGYREINEVVKLPNLRAIMLEDALRDLRFLQQKYQRLQELASVWEAASRVTTTATRKKGGGRKKAA